MSRNFYVRSYVSIEQMAIPRRSTALGRLLAAKRKRASTRWSSGRWLPPITPSWRTSSPCAAATYLRLLQRVRRLLQARPAGGDATGAWTIWAGWAPRIIAIRGGEPLLHPDLDQIIRRIRSTGRHRRHDHQRLSADRGAHRAAQPRRARPHADLHRQRDARRGLEEEPEGAGQEAAAAGRARRVPREHQLRGGRRHPAIPTTRW